MRWRIVALLVALSFMSWFNRVSMAVAYDTTIGERYQVSEEAIGFVYSAFFFSYLLFMTPGGWFADRFGPKLALVIMGLGSGLFGAMTGLAGLPAVTSAGLLVAALLVIRGAKGLVSAPLYPAATRMVVNWVPAPERAYSNGLVQGAAAVGMACAFPCFGALIDLWDWPLAFLASGMLTMLVGLVWWACVSDHPPQHREIETHPLDAEAIRAGAPPPTLPPSATHESWLTLLRDRNLLLLTLSYAAVGYLEYLFFFWMNHYFDKILHIDKKESRIYSAILFLSLAVGMVSGGWLADRLHRRYSPWCGRALVPMAGMALSAVFLGFGVLSAEIDWIVLWMALALAAIGAAESPTWTAAAELGGRHGGTAAGLVNTGGNLGGLIAPVLTPFVAHAVRDTFHISEQAGWQWGISLAGVLCLSGAVLWWWIKPEDSGG